jgi:hypothetical protein
VDRVYDVQVSNDWGDRDPGLAARPTPGGLTADLVAEYSMGFLFSHSPTRKRSG